MPDAFQGQIEQATLEGFVRSNSLVSLTGVVLGSLLPCKKPSFHCQRCSEINLGQMEHRSWRGQSPTHGKLLKGRGGDCSQMTAQGQPSHFLLSYLPFILLFLFFRFLFLETDSRVLSPSPIALADF